MEDPRITRCDHVKSNGERCKTLKPYFVFSKPFAWPSTGSNQLADQKAYFAQVEALFPLSRRIQYMHKFSEKAIQGPLCYKHFTGDSTSGERMGVPYAQIKELLDAGRDQKEQKKMSNRLRKTTSCRYTPEGPEENPDTSGLDHKHTKSSKKRKRKTVTPPPEKKASPSADEWAPIGGTKPKEGKAIDPAYAAEEKKEKESKGSPMDVDREEARSVFDAMTEKERALSRYAFDKVMIELSMLPPSAERDKIISENKKALALIPGTTTIPDLSSKKEFNLQIKALSKEALDEVRSFLYTLPSANTYRATNRNWEPVAKKILKDFRKRERYMFYVSDSDRDKKRTLQAPIAAYMAAYFATQFPDEQVNSDMKQLVDRFPGRFGGYLKEFLKLKYKSVLLAETASFQSVFEQMDPARDDIVSAAVWYDLVSHNYAIADAHPPDSAIQTMSLIRKRFKRANPKPYPTVHLPSALFRIESGYNARDPDLGTFSKPTGKSRRESKISAIDPTLVPEAFTTPLRAALTETKEVKEKEVKKRLGKRDAKRRELGLPPRGHMGAIQPKVIRAPLFGGPAKRVRLDLARDDDVEELSMDELKTAVAALAPADDEKNAIAKAASLAAKAAAEAKLAALGIDKETAYSREERPGYPGGPKAAPLAGGAPAPGPPAPVAGDGGDGAPAAGAPAPGPPAPVADGDGAPAAGAPAPGPPAPVDGDDGGDDDDDYDPDLEDLDPAELKCLMEKKRLADDYQAMQDVNAANDEKYMSELQIEMFYDYLSKDPVKVRKLVAHKDDQTAGLQRLIQNFIDRVP